MRKRLLAERRSLSTDRVRDLGQVIQHHVLELDEFKKARTVALYRPFWNEVMTDLILARARQRGMVVCYPHTKVDLMTFVEEAGQGEFDVDRIDCIFVPGVVFDETRHRIGLGRGCYDRSLAQYRGVKIGLAYDFQVLAQIPLNDHDLVCDHVMTELRHLKA